MPNSRSSFLAKTANEPVSAPAVAAPANLEAPHGSASVHLDALRGLAAFSVAITHWRDAFFLDYSQLSWHNPLMAAAYYFASFGHQWVIVFFVMSGYLVGGSVIRAKQTGRWSWRSYLLARLSRLYVVLLPALLLGGLADWAGMHQSGAEVIYSGHSGVQALTANVYSTLKPTAFLGNALFLQTIQLPGFGLRVPQFGSNGPLWSLANEFWYYLAFPVLVLVLAKSQRFWMRVGGVLLLLAWGWFVGRSIVVLAVPWLMGVWIHYLPPFPARRIWIRTLAIVTSLALVFAGMVLAIGNLADNTTYLPGFHLVVGRNWNFPVYDLLLSVLVTLLIWVLLHCAKARLPSAYVWLAQRSARSSYTLYLIHMPALIFLKAWWHLPRAVPGWHVFLVNLGLLAIVVFYAQLVYELFEKNTDRVRNWVKPYVMGKQSVRSRSGPGKVAAI